jgi:UDP-N-acetylmuramate dehydrogenase
VSTGVCERLGCLFGNRLLLDAPLSNYTTYRIGGPAAAVLTPQSAEEAAQALDVCRETGTPWLVLGLGSNVLVADAGFPGLVMRMGKGIDGVLEQDVEDNVWKVAAGMPTPRLARQTAKLGLAGVHKLIGVPGTVGGGVATNAGAHGQEFCQVVRTVECVATDGTISEVPGSEIDWQYRRGLEGVAVTAVTFEFGPGNSKEQLETIRRLQAERKEQTPFDLPCCGSVFKNPSMPEAGESPFTAGQLIDSVGLKGFRVGAAEVSKVHANYIVNLGGATAAEVHAVIEAVRGRVFGEFGVELELEVRTVE